VIREFEDRFAFDVTRSSTMNVAARRRVQGAAKPGAARDTVSVVSKWSPPSARNYPAGPLMIWTSTCLPFSMRKWP
jgi:hypothetical protein